MRRQLHHIKKNAIFHILSIIITLCVSNSHSFTFIPPRHHKVSVPVANYLRNSLHINKHKRRSRCYHAIPSQRNIVTSRITTTSHQATTTTAETQSSSTDTTSPSSSNTNNTPSSSYDVIIIGSGIGGLTCAAMLSLYNYSVAVFESHYAPGGCAHGFTITEKSITDDGDSGNNGRFVFDTGPSFFSGLSPTTPAKASNPLRTVLDAIDESVDAVTYTTFGLNFPEGELIHSPTSFVSVLESVSSSDDKKAATTEWNRLMTRMEPLSRIVENLPTIALRFDAGAALTAGPYLPSFVAGANPLEAMQLTKSFGSIIESAGVTNEFTKNWLDVLCFCLSGLPADGTIAAEMAMMMGEFYGEDAVMDCPRGGAKAIVDALVRGIEKRGGRIFCKTKVERIAIEEGMMGGKGKATGVYLAKNNRLIKARKAVVSNVSVWNLFAPTTSTNDDKTKGLIDDSTANRIFNPSYLQQKRSTPAGKSFMHLHIGFRITKQELSSLQAHYIHVTDWQRGVAAEDNVALISIPSVHDESLAPGGYAVMHAYTPATEDYERWRRVERGSEEYNELKEERSAFLWTVVEKVIPDVKSRTVVSRIGTPLTHERFLNRWEGSYGPAIKAEEGSFPMAGTPVNGLYVCGDSCFPGIGVPAVAGSGILAAHSCVGLGSLRGQLEVLKVMQQQK